VPWENESRPSCAGLRKPSGDGSWNSRRSAPASASGQRREWSQASSRVFLTAGPLAHPHSTASRRRFIVDLIALLAGGRPRTLTELFESLGIADHDPVALERDHAEALQAMQVSIDAFPCPAG
jgi:hypothetical protein